MLFRSILCTTWALLTLEKVSPPPPNLPPDCSTAIPSQESLWPPNHNFVPIDILGVVDPDGDGFVINITSIFQDEPVDTNGDGKFVPDGMGIDTSTAELRAERSGTKKVPGDGRVYHISFTATDDYGDSCEGGVSVIVPHNVGAEAVDGGPMYDSTDTSSVASAAWPDEFVEKLYLPAIVD